MTTRGGGGRKGILTKCRPWILEPNAKELTMLTDQYNPRQVRVWPPEAPEWCDDPDSLDEILDDAIAEELEEED